MTSPVFELSGAILTLVGPVAVLRGHSPMLAGFWRIVLPVLVGTVARGLLGLTSRYFKGVARAWGRVLFVSQHHFPLGLRDWLHSSQQASNQSAFLRSFLPNAAIAES